MKLASPPQTPSANSQVVLGAVTADEPWPPSNWFQYIARSTTRSALVPPLVWRTTVENGSAIGRFRLSLTSLLT